MATGGPKRILIFRRGSIGDGVVSLPALNRLAETYADAERRLLTNRPVMESAAALQEVVGPSGLVDGFFTFETAGRGRGGRGGMGRLRREIRAWRPDALVYLSEPSSFPALARELLFFASCGIARFIGVPLGGARRRYLERPDGLWESEAERLLRTVFPDDPRPPDFDAHFTDAERAEAQGLLADWPGAARHIAFGVGAKLPDKDWGDDNWRRVLAALAESEPDLGVLSVGGPEDTERAGRLLADWPGPALDLTGKTAARISALAMECARFYLGHDSGPMHLAALAGTPAVAVFGARAKPGVWFPRGEGHRIFYPWALAGRAPARPGFRTAGSSIRAVEADEVIAACREMLAAHPASRAAS